MITPAGVDNEELYRLHATELTRYATGLVGPFDAAGIVTDAYRRAAKSGNWDHVASRRACLYKTVLSVAKDHRRRTTPRRLGKVESAAPKSVSAWDVDVDVLQAVNRPATDIWILVDEETPTGLVRDGLTVGNRILLTEDVVTDSNRLFVSPDSWHPTGDTITPDTWNN